ncbi:MAG: hypothetical protein PHU25_18925 [Deltaproteobacteria bacterium]|nr:hypothetical protein [Deltaproteobacteria bacterium]
MLGKLRFPVFCLVVLSILGGGCLYGATFTLSKELDAAAVKTTVDARPRKTASGVAFYRTPPRQLYVVLGTLEKTEMDWADGNVVDALVASLKQEAARLGGDGLVNVKFGGGVADEPQAPEPASRIAIQPAPFTGLTATADVIMFVSADELARLRKKGAPVSAPATLEPGADVP